MKVSKFIKGATLAAFGVLIIAAGAFADIASCVKDANFFDMIEKGIMGRREQPVTPEMSATAMIVCTASGSFPSALRICWRASRLMTAWKSRTIVGNGCGPMTEPRQ